MENTTKGDISNILASLLQRTASQEVGKDGQTKVQVARGEGQTRVLSVSTRLIFICDVKISSRDLEPLNPFLALMFDRGTLFTANRSLVLLWKSTATSSLGRSFNMFLWRNGSTDFVKINIGVGDLTVEKVESAQRCITEGSESFFLPASGIVQVEDFHLKSTGRPWIVSGEVLCSVQNNISNQHNIMADMKFVLNRIMNSSDTALSSSQMVSDGRTRPTSSSSCVGAAAPVSVNRSALLSSVPDIKYPALTVSQALHCTRCKKCEQTFRFTIEYLYHFAIQTTCYTGPTDQLYNRVSEDIVKNVEVNPSRLVCMKAMGAGRSCLSKFQSALQYCLHVDDHRPNSGELFSCYKCSAVFFTPFSFYRHACLMTLKPGSGGGSPGQLRGCEYKMLTRPLRDNILTCSKCCKKFSSISGLVDHLNPSNSACLTQLSRGRKVRTDGQLDLASLLLAQSNTRLQPVQCEVCMEVLDNQVSYCLHQDHHTRQGGEAVCRDCSASYSTLCKYFKHACNNNWAVWCVFCQILNRKETHANSPVEIIKLEEIKLEEFEENLPKIVSVSGSVNFEDDVLEVNGNCNQSEGTAGAGAVGDTKKKKKMTNKRRSCREKSEGFNKWKSYYCLDCASPRILNLPGQIRHHVRTTQHTNIKPAWKLNQVDVKLFNLKKSYKYGVLVREHLADYYSQKRSDSVEFLEKIINSSKSSL